MKIEDKFELIFSFEESHEPNIEGWYNIMACLNDAPLLKPDLIRTLEMPDYPISGTTDELVMRAIKTEKMIEIKRSDGRLNIVFLPVGRQNMLINMHRDDLKKLPVVEISQLFKHIINCWEPKIGECSFYSVSKHLYNVYYQYKQRTNLSPGLVWLQFFGKDEFIRQGGEDIFSNPYVIAEKFGNGVLIQVGKSPFDAYTPEGEKLLVEATNAMPPTKN